LRASFILPNLCNIIILISLLAKVASKWIPR